MPRSLNICLIRPPNVNSKKAVGQDGVLPLGLAYIAGTLTTAGHTVTAIDAVGEAPDQYQTLPSSDDILVHGLNAIQIAKRVPSDTQVIGLSCMFTGEWIYTREVLRILRLHFPNALIVLGGEHASALPEYILQTEPAADVIVCGEGEETIKELLEQHSNGSSLDNVLGISFRRQGIITHNGRRTRIRAIDSIPPPQWSLFPVRNYISRSIYHGVDLGPAMPVLASRGCPYQCTFCSSPQMWTTAWNAREPKLLLNEMKTYMRDYGATSFTFHDLTALIKRDWLIEFAKLLIEEDLNITWQLPSGTRTEIVDSEVAQLLFKSGCRVLDYAPESGSPSELKRIKKRVDLGWMLNSIRESSKAGLQLKVNIIFGFPDSSFQDIIKTLAFVTKLVFAGATDVAAFPFCPYPGSALFERLRSEGLIQFNDDYLKSLFAYANGSAKVSYSRHIPGYLIPWLSTFTMSYFYLLSFVIHPSRLFRLALQIIHNEKATRLSMAIFQQRRKKLSLKIRGTYSIFDVATPEFQATS